MLEAQLPVNIDDRLCKAISKLSKDQKEELLVFINDLLFEKRNHRRDKCNTEVSYADSNRFARGYIQNISANGLYIEPSGPFDPEQIITLTFEHPTGNGHVKVTGKIVRRDQKGVGVQFAESIDV